MSDISGAIIWPIRVAFGVALMFLARRALMLWVPVPHILAVVGLALAMWGAIWLIAEGLRAPAGGLRRPYDARVRR